jgi:hypothetical protein
LFLPALLCSVHPIRTRSGSPPPGTRHAVGLAVGEPDLVRIGWTRHGRDRGRGWGR